MLWFAGLLFTLILIFWDRFKATTDISIDTVAIIVIMCLVGAIIEDAIKQVSKDIKNDRVP